MNAWLSFTLRNLTPLLLTLMVYSSVTAAQPMMVDQGKPLAQILIAPDAPRPVPVAAKELQTYIKKITGAELPIRTKAEGDLPVRIYVGQSQYTRDLGIDVSDLKYGAFKMNSGDHWLALVGNDSNYVFRQPFPESLEDKDKIQKAWEKISGGQWYAPYGTQPLRHYNPELNLWYLDERGSINAVYRYLNDMGVRWFLPSELGEVLPAGVTSLALPEVNKTVRPDFSLRQPHSRMGFRNTEEALWAMRMGWDCAPAITGPYITTAVAHGMTRVTDFPENRAKHPEFFAMLNGKRFMPLKNPSFCLSNEDLIDQNVRFLRAVFDTYDPMMVSVQPADGNVLVCQCDQCAGKATPERGRRGEASDYVWEYIERVAEELYKTHPDKMIAALAYANYQLPPTKIAKLSPNIIVGVPSGRTFTHNNPAEQKLVDEIRQEWIKKLPNPVGHIYQYEYFMDARPGRRTQYLPVFVTGSIARSLRATKGYSIGEHIDLERYRENMTDLGVMHLNLYVTSKLWWDADQDLDALLEDYYQKYYGPAAAAMKKTITFAEANWTAMPSNPDAIRTFFSLMADAKKLVPDDSVYGKRIALMAAYTQPMESILTKAEVGRDQSVPPIVLRGPRPAVTAKDVTIDGKLDENVWQNVRGKGTPERLNLPEYSFSQLVDGQKPKYPTTFKVFWAEDAMYIGIRCADPDSSHLNSTATARDDSAIWKGDMVEIHLETQKHSYYAIVVNPAGAVLDLDWKGRARETGWDANAKVATHVGDGFWSVEMRIPVVDEMDSDIVELGGKGVVGQRPTKLYPWYMNLVRQRVRGDEKECSAYSPTGSKSFHNLVKFARVSPAR